MRAALWVVGAVLALDLATKHLIMNTLQPNESLAIWPGILHLTYVRNPGAAYGLLAKRTWVLVVLAAVVVIGALVYVRTARRLGEQYAFGFLIGGAAGNMLDRLRWGLVTDFIEIKPLPIFRVFNVADMAISTAVVLLLLLSLRRDAVNAPD